MYWSCRYRNFCKKCRLPLDALARDLGIGRVQLDPDAVALQAVGDKTGGAGAEKRVQYHAAWRAACADAVFGQLRRERCEVGFGERMRRHSPDAALVAYIRAGGRILAEAGAAAHARGRAQALLVAPVVLAARHDAATLTRIGIGAKAVVTGDVTQIDLQRGQKSGLIEARQILRDVRGIAFTEFQKEDVVRHPLVARIVSAYEAHTAALEEKAHERA